MTAFVSGVVQVMWQGSRFSGGTAVSNENGTTGSSPGCSSMREKSMEERSTRQGVPVLKRRSGIPSASSESVSPVAAYMPSGPPS